MKSFKSKNKKEEEDFFKKETEQTKINQNNNNLSVFQKNPQTKEALIKGIFGVTFSAVPIISIIIVIYASRQLLRAKKIGENKKFINITYCIVYIPIIFLIIMLLMAFYSVKSGRDGSLSNEIDYPTDNIYENTNLKY